VDFIQDKEEEIPLCVPMSSKYLFYYGNASSRAVVYT